MVLMIAAGLLILAIAFYQTTQGFYSSLIMALLAVLCAAAAFNYYEPLAELLVPRLGMVAYGTSLLALFVLPLFILREITDRFLPANVLLGAWPDRIGACACGLLTAMIMTGMLMIVVWTLPLPASVLWYRPYDDALAVKDSGPPRWAAGFTAGLARRLSAGSLASFSRDRQFDTTGGDLSLDLYALRNRPAGIGVAALPDSMDVVPGETYFVGDPNQKNLKLPPPLDTTPLRNPLIEPGVPTKVFVVRVRVDQNAHDENAGAFVLPATNFRLATKAPDGAVASYYPVGYLTWAAGAKQWYFNTAPDNLDPIQGKVEIGKIIVTRPWKEDGGPAKLCVDWVYRIPAADTPVEVVFRRSCAAKLLTVPWHNELPSDPAYIRLALGLKPGYTPALAPAR